MCCTCSCFGVATRYQRVLRVDFLLAKTDTLTGKVPQANANSSDVVGRGSEAGKERR